MESLFDALPRDLRRDLEDLPAVVKRLQSHAQEMRKRIADMVSLAAQAGQGVALAQATKRREVVADLEAVRESAQARLGEIIAALETLRLGLLRLHGGVGRVDAVSADLTAAKRIAGRTDLLEAGAVEVERLLAGEPRIG